MPLVSERVHRSVEPRAAEPAEQFLRTVGKETMPSYKPYHRQQPIMVCVHEFAKNMFTLSRLRERCLSPLMHG